MDKALATQLLEQSGRATEALAALVEEAKQHAPGLGAKVLESGVWDVWGKIVMGLMSPAWDQHPELKPGPDLPDDQAYNPDWFVLPKRLVIKASLELARVQALVAEMRRLVEGSALSAHERAWFDHHFGVIDANIAQQQFNVRQYHPAFRGPEPKEEVPAAQQADAADEDRDGSKAPRADQRELQRTEPGVRRRLRRHISRMGE